jgi:hypothetical protein
LITNTGKNILGKYLVGQTPAYASYIALGVGQKPMSELAPEVDYSSQKSLEFEVLRVPISSRGYVYDENNNPNIVFAAELPTDQRYEFTEVGIYPAKLNSVAGSTDSKMIYTFSTSENWEYHSEEKAISVGPAIEQSLDSTGNRLVITGKTLQDVTGLESDDDEKLIPFRGTANNDIFSNADRLLRNEKPRFLNSGLFIPGDLSHLESDAGRLSIKEADEEGYYGSHIHLTGLRFNLDRNSSEDELRLAFSVLNKAASQDEELARVRILLEFASSDVVNPENFARVEVDLTGDFDDRYFVFDSKIADLIKSNTFTWNTVNTVKVYVSTFELDDEEEVLSNNFYVALDGLRLENLSTNNPLYGLVGYSVVRNLDAAPISKEIGTNNLMEFRFGLEVN